MSRVMGATPPPGIVKFDVQREREMRMGVTMGSVVCNLKISDIFCADNA